MLRQIPASSVLLLATLLVPVLPACTSNSSSGGGGTTVSSYCSDLSSYVSRCNITDPCTTGFVRQCGAVAASYSAAALAAAESCVNGAACGDGGTAAVGTCIQQKGATAAPTATQTKLAQDYCAACASAANTTTAQCVSGFYTAGGAPTPGGPGAGLLTLSDSIAASIDTQCIPKLAADAGGFGCGFAFPACYLPIELSALGPALAACGGNQPGPDASTGAPDGG